MRGGEGLLDEDDGNNSEKTVDGSIYATNSDIMRLGYSDDQLLEEKNQFTEAAVSYGKESHGTVDLNIKPKVTNQELQNAIDEIYKGQGSRRQIGNGSVMDAVRNEQKTGGSTKGKYHSKKARGTINRLEKQIGIGRLSIEEKKIARELIKDLKKALSGN